ncbi:hypothetical protein B296_00012021 [Ensete ventricosum]|uniref:Uncharacterized protein n=1 Tax=Ensete ventricosum TaxID=4639 RepID=A0A427API3_ENSVE|nr:hypothetical protein B296_00012021 [Ensete ventricosum]
MEEAPKPGYTLWELCEVEDRVGAERYFAAVMTQLKVAEGEDPLMPRWSVIAGSSQFWIEGLLSREYLHGEYLLVNRASKSVVWVSVISSIPLVFFPSFSLSSLFLLFAGASLYDCSHRPAQLEGDVLLLTEAAALLEVELKDEGAKVVVAFKASRGFELGLKKMGRVSYEFEYRVALEQLRGKHPKNRDRARPIR